jgi:hypothetical protein
MKRLLCDHLLAMPASDDDREPLLEVVRAALKKPAHNHAAMPAAEQSLGMCDRFVLSKQFTAHATQRRSRIKRRGTLW